MKKSFKKIAAAAGAGLMAMALALTAVPNKALAYDISDEAKEAGEKEFDPNGTYHAYFMIQIQHAWIYRDPMSNSESGRTSEHWNNIVQNVDKVVTPVSGTITDAEITGNGTYTVKVEGLDGVMTENPDGKVAYLGVSTDMPINDTVKITNIKTKIDNSTKLEQPEAIIDDEEPAKTLTILCSNTYRGTEALGTEFVLPYNSVEITFDVAGFAKDKVEEETPSPEPTEDASAESDSDSSSDTSDDDSEGGVPIVPIVVVVVVVIAAAVIVVVMKKKK